MKKAFLALALFVGFQAHAGQKILTCESFNGFKVDADGGSSGHLFKVELTSEDEAVLLQSGSKVSNKSISFETEELAKDVIQLTFKDYRKMYGIDLIIPSVRYFTEVVVVAKSPQALVNYLQSQDMISKEDSRDLLKANSRAASYTLTRTGLLGDYEGTPYPNVVNAYHPCR